MRSSPAESVGDGPIVAEVDGAALASADADGGVVILSKFPLTASLVVDLDLRRFQITGPNTRFLLGSKTGDDQTLRFDPSRVILLRGRATGYPDSHVFMAVSDLGST
ncbi:MAG: hypothetical protein IID39_10005, partial [Planctomycetes bacterium]|nr:hypothetical protein [Planctomycetota bacterium]